MNFKEAKQIIKKLKSVDKKIGEYSSLTEKYEQEALAASEAYLKKEKEDILNSMPIEELSKAKLGIRVTALRNAGITSIGKLQGYSEKALLRINGIGESSAKNAVAVCKDLVNNVNQNTRITISPEDNRVVSDNLVHSLYKANASAAISERASALHNKTHSDIKTLIKNSLPSRNRILWFLSPKYIKEKAEDCIKEAEALLAGSYKDEFEEMFKREQEILQASHDKYWKDFAKNAASYYSRIEHVKQQGKRKSSASVRNQEIAIRSGLSENLIQQIDSVELNLSGLKCIPRSYQAFGIKYILNQGSVLLGDEMGLGKTIQAIGVMVSLKNSGEKYFLVVCPNSVLINWQREIQKHSNLTPYILHGNTLETSFAAWRKNGGVGISTYEAISKLSLPDEFTIDILVADEAHYVKNPNAQRTQALLSLMAFAKRKLFMTGTALENNVKEMLFLIQCLQPSIAEKLGNLTRQTDAAAFRQTVAPVYFRRVRDDVMTELPQKVENEEWCQMGEAESTKYCEAVMAKDFMRMRQVSWDVESLSDSSKAARLKDLCDEAMESGRKIIVFSFFINTINQAKSLFSEDICYGPITGSISPERRQQIIDDFTNAEGGAVLLSQIQAGGTGLNIQAASVVIFCEPQLKPSLENQAISRAYRMGQVNTVMVYRLLCEKSADERIMGILSHKQALFDAFAEESVSGKESVALEGSETGNIVAQEVERLKLELVS